MIHELAGKSKKDKKKGRGAKPAIAAAAAPAKKKGKGGYVPSTGFFRFPSLILMALQPSSCRREPEVKGQEPCKVLERRRSGAAVSTVGNRGGRRGRAGECC